MNNKFTFFWHTHSPFSQWHPAIFTIGNNQFSSAEQYMMFQKACLFRDKKIATKIIEINSEKIVSDFIQGKIKREQILKEKDLKESWGAIQKRIKALGREVNGYDEKVWTRNRERIVQDGNFAKFSQNKDLKKIILETKGTILVEASPYDKIWGIGLKESDPKALNEATWNGLNLLGKALDIIKEKF